MRILPLLFMFSFTFLNGGNSSYNDSFYTITYKVGTLGFGADLSHSFNKTFAARLNINGYSDYRHMTLDKKRYQMQGLLNSTGLLFDIHPWQNAFLFSWGAYYSKSHLTFINKPKSGRIVVGDHSYSAMEVGKVTADIKLKRRINPYFGLGLNSTAKNDKWHFVLDVGAVYIDTPKANVQAQANNGFKALQPILDKESQTEQGNLNKKLRKYKIYPVISVGVGFNF